MLLTRTNHGAFDAVNRLGVSLFVVLVATLMFWADSASAASIFADYSLSSADVRDSLERPPGGIGPLDASMALYEECGCGSAPASPNPDSLPSNEPLNHESPTLIEFAATNNRGGTSSNDSSVSNGVQFSAAVLAAVHLRPQSSVIGWLRLEKSLEIPVAPPFELLRPPRV